MNIEYPESSSCVGFLAVDVGCVFKFKGEYFIKILNKGQQQALRLSNYNVFGMFPDDMVEIYPASKLTIK